MNIDFSDRPCGKNDTDSFSFKKRIVGRIHSFLINDPISPLTIAITGEWGIGKSTVINWLKDEISNDEKNLIITFEPLLEGRLEIVDIIELFYLSLFDQVKSKTFRGVIKKSLKSIALLARFKMTARAKIQAPLVGAVEASVEKDFGKDIDDILEAWSKQELKLFSDQTKEINKNLKGRHKLYVFIDEIDRLTSGQIINFLLFARTLELFDNLVCIIGIDYSRVIQKLISEQHLGLANYDTAKSYIDKLFQCKFQVHINDTEKLNFIQGKMKLIDRDGCLNELLDLNLSNSDGLNIYNEMREIASYLSTPRHLKKWLTSVKQNYLLIKYTPNKLSFLKFLAATVMHPLLFENFSKYTGKLLEKNIRLQLALKNEYGINSYADGEFRKDLILLASLGVKDKDIDGYKTAEAFYKKVLFKVDENDYQAIKFSRCFLEDTPDYIKTLLLEGYFDNESVSAYYEFMEGNIDVTIRILLEDAQNSDLLALDLSDSLKSFSVRPKNPPSINLLIRLWREKCQDNFFNPFYRIALFCLIMGFGSFKTIIDHFDLSMSEAVILYYLEKLGIKNKNGQYDITHFIKKNIEQVQLRNTDNQIIQKEEDVRTLLSYWLNKISETLSDNNSDWYEQTHLVSVFYRYIQFGKTLGDDKRDELSTYLVQFIESKIISNESKKVIVELLTEECKKYENPLSGYRPDKTPLQILFNNNNELKKCIQNFSRLVSIKYIDSFNNLI